MKDLKETCFERAVFYSWSCKLDECCKYCYMSTLPREKRTDEKVRSFASLLAETIITKQCGWDYGFLSGGIGVFSDEKLIDLLQKTKLIMGEKVWVNFGVLSRSQLEKFKPFIKGVVGTVEVLDPILHRKICPSKPLEPVERMFETAKELGIPRGMTLIIGLGETLDDHKLLVEFIRKYEVSKIHIYGLNPHKGTAFEGAEPPSVEYQSEWIKRTREAFPDIDIQAGIWLDRTGYVGKLLEAGADSISKFPALKSFGSQEAKEIERQAKLAGRKFRGTLTKLPMTNWDEEVDKLGAETEIGFDEKLKESIKEKIKKYLKKMKTS
ncbi:radical SAM protein [Candidatus Woesearchaeota archaeon]|nr:radical SAM protein [Candidatus Woesearchaeota archaeon]